MFEGVNLFKDFGLPICIGLVTPAIIAAWVAFTKRGQAFWKRLGTFELAEPKPSDPSTRVLKVEGVQAAFVLALLATTLAICGLGAFVIQERWIVQPPATEEPGEHYIQLWTPSEATETIDVHNFPLMAWVNQSCKQAAEEFANNLTINGYVPGFRRVAVRGKGRGPLVSGYWWSLTLKEQLTNDELFKMYRTFWSTEDNVYYEQDGIGHHYSYNEQPGKARDCTQS